MAGGGGSGGGGRSDTQQHAEYPEEFKPLAEAAVRQIIGLQGRLPLAEFGVPQEARVAGLSPFTQAGMSLVPSMMMRTPPEQALQQVPTAIGDLLGQFGGVMQPTNASQGALRFLGGQIGQNVNLFPSAWQPPQRLPQIAQGGTAFPGVGASPSAGGTPGAGGGTPFDFASLIGGMGGGTPGAQGADGVLTAPPLMPLSTPLPLQTQFDQFAAGQQAAIPDLIAQQLAAQQAAQAGIPPGWPGGAVPPGYFPGAVYSGLFGWQTPENAATGGYPAL